MEVEVEGATEEDGEEGVAWGCTAEAAWTATLATGDFQWTPRLRFVLGVVGRVVHGGSYGSVSPLMSSTSN